MIKQHNATIVQKVNGSNSFNSFWTLQSWEQVCIKCIHFSSVHSFEYQIVLQSLARDVHQNLVSKKFKFLVSLVLQNIKNKFWEGLEVCWSFWYDKAIVESVGWVRLNPVPLWRRTLDHMCKIFCVIKVVTSVKNCPTGK